MHSESASAGSMSTGICGKNAASVRASKTPHYRTYLQLCARSRPFACILSQANGNEQFCCFLQLLFESGGEKSQLLFSIVEVTHFPMSANMSLSTVVVAILVFLTIHEDIDLLTLTSKTSGCAVGDQVMNLRCRCITKERKPIGRRIVALEVHPVRSHCAETEIIATLKNEKRKVCLDPNAPWVQKVLAIRRARNMGFNRN
ncbi:hypothetical protein CCH79_00012378, partial [Gambusia affinis]